MKIHGKILHHYLSCSAPVVKEGFLYKKGEVNTSYQKRWCTLKGNLLFYRDRPGDREILGVVVLEGCSVQLCESDEQFAFSLVFSETGLRTYKFSAENQKSQEGWVKALHSANHSFLSILLQDLRQQYLETAEALGVKPVDCSQLVKESMPHSQKPYVTSVFYAVPGAKESGGLGNNQHLLVPPPGAKHASKRSPKLWPKRHAHVMPLNGPPPALGEWSEPTEEFSKMHEDYGREVRQLVADWQKKKRRETTAMPEEDLIDLG
ncbi:sesquipedalian-1-like [Colossoma macropomum]|uniref:sesquipedalian-1-like n=1 Tax=Colossoma macropomum TaxID=42526 RepID=UPI001863D285|nr:sesquipedalian-1-like [Colossoma macropomum]XP_036429129.1 sesquipedalian-1-like [Colossoma macropomum]XP_036429130.1 sesquipedalian-1-like [Colossoma macropomum]XP_036429131.1 sesquipedalian-1-like [Colossoma macropomum]XP_036429132.1 sesquipedalian-1-like [Colossoma macropomum]XP_036429133.1 sesquipedalian-1-like [Colossoma macropomum]XP_036429134.1 sesquipedalian-1-like [Colossoma macropomum]